MVSHDHANNRSDSLGEVSDRNSLEVWFRSQTREYCSIVALRAALRVYPAVSQIRTLGVLDVRKLIEQAFLRSAVATINPTLETKKAVDLSADTLAFLKAESRGEYSYFVEDVAYIIASAVSSYDFSVASFMAVIEDSAAAFDNIFSRENYFDGQDVFSTDLGAMWAEISRDVSLLSNGVSPPALFGRKLWSASNLFEAKWLSLRSAISTSDTYHIFWIDWYQRILDGRLQNWEMLEEIALIDPEDWDKGAEHVNGLVAGIQARYAVKKKSNVGATSKLPVSRVEADRMAARVELNRDSLVLTIVGVVGQVAEYREQIRGNNHLEVDVRNDLLGFLDNLSEQLSELLSNLPKAGETINQESSEEYVRWLTKFGSFLRSKALTYMDPENVAGAVIPTGIIMGSMGIGAMLGQPVAGAVVGGLITNQMKPGKAAEAILKPDVEGE